MKRNNAAGFLGTGGKQFLAQRPICYACGPLNNPVGVLAERIRLFVALVPRSLPGALVENLFAATIFVPKD
jgi:hypothetical protein